MAQKFVPGRKPRDLRELVAQGYSPRDIQVVRGGHMVPARRKKSTPKESEPEAPVGETVPVEPEAPTPDEGEN